MKQVAPKEGYVKALLQLCREQDSNYMVLEADVANSTGTALVRGEFPGSFLDVGISEQDLVGTAAGMALAGIVPFATAYAVYLTGKALDQIRTMVCYDNLNVKLAGAHSGFSAGRDGGTHHALEDVALMRVLPNMTVLVPCDALQVEKAALAAARWEGPCYLRFGREPRPVITTEDTPFEVGKARLVRYGSDILILANGSMVSEAISAAQLLEKQGIDAMVADIHTVKPLDEEFILEAARRTGAVVTAEEHQRAGGLGGAVCELLSEQCPVPVYRVGVDDSFGESGSQEELMQAHGLDDSAIVQATYYLLHRK